MDIKRPWHTLNIDVSGALNPAFDFEQLKQDVNTNQKNSTIWQFELDNNQPECFSWWFQTRETVPLLLDHEWLIETQKQLKIRILHCTLIYKSKNYISEIAHVDSVESTMDTLMVNSAINWCVNNDDNAEMIWYDVPRTSLPAFRTATDQVIFFYKGQRHNDPHTTYSRVIGKQATLVNTAMPHEILINARDRWCVSMRYKNYSWQEVTEKLKPLILE